MIPSTQSSSVSSRYSFSSKDFETHTPVLEILSPVPARPWKLNDFIELHNGDGNLCINCHETIADENRKHGHFLQEEDKHSTQMGKETTSSPPKKGLVTIIAEVSSQSELGLEPVEEEATMNNDTVMRCLESDESIGSLKDSMEDENDEVWSRIDNPETMDENENWWQSNDDFISNESLSIAVKKILRVTNPVSTSQSLVVGGHC